MVASRGDSDGSPAQFGAPARLRHRHASHLLGLAKPDAAIYHAFAHQTGFSPNRIVFFDDLAENIQAARASGWNAHQIDHAGDFHIANTPVSRDQLASHLKARFVEAPPLKLYLRADRNTPARTIRDFMKLATEAGAVTVIFGSYPSQQ